MSTTPERFLEVWQNVASQKDVKGLVRLIDQDAVLISPISSKAILGLDIIENVFRAILDVIPDLKYTSAKAVDDGGLLLFEGTLPGAVRIEGVDLFKLDSAGSVTELKVFVRPLKAANIFAAEMKSRL